jgi:hypothetical protein
MLGLSAAAVAATAIPAAAQEAKPLYGLIGQMLASPGKRDELVGYLKEATGAMPGCLSYVVALDTANPDAIWITEVWDSRESHAASLNCPPSAPPSARHGRSSRASRSISKRCRWRGCNAAICCVGYCSRRGAERAERAEDEFFTRRREGAEIF